MKKLTLIVTLLLAVVAVFAVKVVLADGREFEGDLLSSQENRIVIQDKGIIIQIPAEQVKAITEEGMDITSDVLARASLGQATDPHFIEEDDFFISDIPLEGNSAVQLKIAKLINPATQSTKMQAQFMLIGDGTQIWTKNYYSTKIGKAGMLKAGQAIIFFEGKGDTDILVGPQSDDAKRSGTWTMAKVSDLTKINEGYVVMSNNMKVSIDNIRVIAK